MRHTACNQSLTLVRVCRAADATVSYCKLPSANVIFCELQLVDANSCKLLHAGAGPKPKQSLLCRARATLCFLVKKFQIV